MNDTDKDDNDAKQSLPNPDQVEGAARWVCTDLKSDDTEDVQKVLELSEAGKSTSEIGKELSMSKSRVDRLLKKANRTKKAKPAAPRE